MWRSPSDRQGVKHISSVVRRADVTENLIKRRYTDVPKRTGDLMNTKLMFKSSCDNWKTPDDVYNKLNEEFHFDFDPCPLNERPDFDGLEIE